MGKRGIGYDCLDRSGRELYDSFLRAFSAGAMSVAVPAGMDSRRVLEVFCTALGDNPGVIRYDRTGLTVKTLGTQQTAVLKQAMAPGQVPTMERALAQQVQRAMAWVRRRNPRTDYDRLVAAYEYLQDHVRYDRGEARNALTGRAANPHSHTAYGALVRERAVCDGIAGAFALLCQTMGYRCTVLSGESRSHCQNRGSHAWNLLQVGRHYYHVDATWDGNHREDFGTYDYNWFCVDDETIRRDHFWRGTTPPCRSRELSYYVRNGCEVRTLVQAEAVMRRCFTGGNRVVRLRFVGNSTTSGETLGKLLSKCATDAGRYGRLRYSWNPDTRCFFGEFTG